MDQDDKKTLREMMKTINFIVERMVTREDLHEVRESLEHKIMALEEHMMHVEDRVMNVEERVTHVEETVLEVRDRVNNIDRTVDEIQNELEPLSKAHSKDAETIVQHEQRITRVEKELALA